VVEEAVADVLEAVLEGLVGVGALADLALDNFVVES
jgi:hypothetical protein